MPSRSHSLFRRFRVSSSSRPSSPQHRRCDCCPRLSSIRLFFHHSVFLSFPSFIHSFSFPFFSNACKWNLFHVHSPIIHFLSFRQTMRYQYRRNNARYFPNHLFFYIVVFNCQSMYRMHFRTLQNKFYLHRSSLCPIFRRSKWRRRNRKRHATSKLHLIVKNIQIMTIKNENNSSEYIFFLLTFSPS